MFAILNAPGSWHDSHIAGAGKLYDIFESRVPEGHFVIADSAFPSPSSRTSKIRRQSKANEWRAVTTEGKLLERDYGSARQTVEWGNGGFQAAYPRLKIPLPCVPSSFRLVILETAALMYNLRTCVIR